MRKAPTVQHTARLFALHPIAAAAIAALPWMAHAQTRPVAPAPTALPTRAPGWLVSGQGTWNVSGANALIDQQSQRAIYQWQNFNIGRDASVTYQFNRTDGAALNRVIGADPSQIFGALRSTVPGANGARVQGGTVMLINGNGILFGETARVNTGSFFASTLNITNDDFNSGLSSISTDQPTFRHEGGAELFTDDRSFVRVDAGAQIETTNGGQVFLFAKKVDNNGTIRTPGGQTALAGGDAVFLNDPSQEKLYASEANPAVPALRGLLVEVGGTAGSVANHGTIETPRGNATLVAMSVNQSGTIRATTSVTENGSVFLLARGGAAGNVPNGGEVTKRATTAGALVLGENSRIEITPDQPADGAAPLTIDGNATFTASRIELAGQTVSLQRGATIAAPGAVVNLRAEDVPNYEANTRRDPNFNTDSTTARIVLADSARIDVSGSTDTRVSVARNFVTTELIGGADLADSPLQRDGPIYRSRVTFDVRTGAPILADSSVQAYRDSVRTTAGELMSNGGTVSLLSTGSVVTHERSTIDVSGGQVAFTPAAVQATMLVASDGRRLSIGDAPKDITYSAIEGRAPRAADGTLLQDRWGQAPQWTASRARVEPGYVEGRAAGTVNVLGQRAVLDGRLIAGTVAGERQQTGKDSLAATATLELGRRSYGDVTSGPVFGSSLFADAAAFGDFSVVSRATPLDEAFWANATSAALDAPGRISAATLNDAGFGNIYITSKGTLQQEADADLALRAQSRLEWRTTGEGGITLNADTRGTGASVLAQTADGAGLAGGGVTLAAGQTIDVAGNWVNRALDGAATPAAVAGGSVQLLSAHGLNVAAGSTIDVSGGVTVSASGAVTGTAAGRIALESNRTVRSTNVPLSPMIIDGKLMGYSLSQGGSLRVRASEIDIVAAAAPLVTTAASPASLQLSTGFFTQGGFGRYDVDGAARLTLADGVTLAPRQDNWVAGAEARNTRTGARPGDALSVARLDDALRRPTQLGLASSGQVTDDARGPSGALTIARGAVIDTDTGAVVNLTANARLNFDGRLQAHGGQVSLGLSGIGWQADSTIFPGLNTSATGFAGTFRIGDSATIDTSAATVLSATTDGSRQGRMVDGGTITLSFSGDPPAARQTLIDVAPGARLVARGASDTLQVSVQGGEGRRRQDERVIGAPGSIVIHAQQGGARVAGQLDARSVDATVPGGRLVITQPDYNTAADVGEVAEHAIRISAGPLPAPIADERGAVRISAQTINAGGFGELSLRTPQRVDFDGNVEIDVNQRIAIDAAVVSASAGSDVLLTAPSLRLSAPSAAPQRGYTATEGTARLVVAAGRVELAGEQTQQGLAQFSAIARSHIELQGVTSGAQAGAVSPGALRTLADVTFAAPQTSVATLSPFTIDAPDQLVRFTEGRADSAPLLAAGGSLTVNAGTILQDGVLRAPLGSITLNASESLVLSSGSVTSVSGAGVNVPFGSTNGGRTLSYLGQEIAGLPAKNITLTTGASGRVDVASGATVDLSAGGNATAIEFVPGPGGSTDAFAGAANGAFAVVPTITEYAPYDAQIALGVDATGKAAAIATGRTITFSGNEGPLPAGTYAVLPARYALMPGAFLVTPNGSSRVEPGVTQRLANGTTLVGATLGIAGTPVKTPATGFVVRTAAEARSLSEMRLTTTDALQLDAATQAGRAPARLAQDAGTLNIAAPRLALDGTVRFDAAASPITNTVSRGGNVAISATRIEVADGGAPAADVLRLSAAQLNALGAETITLGALRRDVGDGTVALDVGATSLVLGAGSAPLRAADIVLAASESLVVRNGAQLDASGTAPADNLRVQGDGALVRVAADAAATSVRSDAQRVAGTLDIAAGSDLRGNSFTAEATAGTTIADGAAFDARAITIGAAQIAVGEPGTAPIAANTLRLSPTLTQRLVTADAATLRSFDSIDFYGNATLGAATLGTLTLDAGALNVATPQGTARVTAGSVNLVNSSGAVAPPASSTASGELQISATSGDVRIGPGALALSGVQRSTVNAARSVVFDGTGSVTASGDVTLAAQSVTATNRADATITSPGLLSITRPDGSTDASLPRATAGAGARLALRGAQVQHDGTIELPSGVLEVTATTGAAQFGEGSLTQLQGRSQLFDGQPVATSGGTLTVSALAGDVRLFDEAWIDVSAGGAGARAGTVNLSATQGRLVVDSNLRATSQAGDGLGGTLRLDSAAAFNLDQLAGQVADGRTSTLDNFARRIEVRNRQGDQRLEAGTTLAAEQIALSADSGAMTLAGTLDASGVQGGEIRVSARDDVRVESGAVLRANSSGVAGSPSRGGEVSLMTGEGRVGLASGAMVEARDAAGGSAGVLRVRAPRVGATAAADVGTEIAVDALAANLDGVRRIEVEGFKVYGSTANTTVNSTLIGRIESDNAAFAGIGGERSDAILARLTANDASLADRTSVRAGVELRSTGNITMSSAWNLSTFDDNGSLARPGGQPVNLTVRAQRDLTVSASLSDGLRNSNGPASAIAPEAAIVGTGADLRLVGGADLSAADPLAVIASADDIAPAGNLTIGRSNTDVIVRTTSGRIDIAAGGDVRLLNQRAVVYTTGVPVSQALLVPYVAPATSANNAFIRNADGGTQRAMVSAGGSVSVQAGRDVIGAADSRQSGVDWWWRGLNLDDASWYVRYDKFRQGFGALGGGDVSVSAGRDAIQVQASAPPVGFLNNSPERTLVVGFAGGRASIEAQRDIDGGWLWSGGDRAQARAGRNITDKDEGLQVLHGNSDVNVSARGDATVGRVTQPGLLSPVLQWSTNQVTSYLKNIAGFGPEATLAVVSDAADTTHTGRANSQIHPRLAEGELPAVAPAQITLAAPQGSVVVVRGANLIQAPSVTSSLMVAAGENVTFGDGNLTVSGANAAQALQTVLSTASLGELIGDPFAPGARPMQSETAAPARVVAQRGDIELAQSLSLTTPLRMIAGDDIRQTSISGGTVNVQHTQDTQLSLLQAGGDIELTRNTVPSGSTLNVHGPGDLVVMAGGQIDLGQSGGIAAVGNRQNAALVAQSARLTVLAGVSFDRGDYRDAVDRYTHVLGGSGIVGNAAALTADLAQRSGAAAGPAYDGLSPAARVERARELVGAAAFDASLLRFMRHRSGDPKLDLAAARNTSDSLDDAGRSALAANALADRWLVVAPLAERDAAVASWAAARPAPTDKLPTADSSLREFMAAQTGQADITLAEAVQGFDALAPERQLLHLNAVLGNDLRRAGRASASAASEAEREAAYQHGLDALAALFPQRDPSRRADLLMGASQIKTLQGSGVTMLAPRGGVNVGQLTASSQGKSSSDLGVVTTGGGPISMVVRDDVEVNRSRVFTVGRGDLLIWASEGDIDAGRGAKTVTGAPPPVYRLVNGQIVVDTSGSYAGSGIAVLDADSTLDLYAPRGTIDAGDAGIKSAGNAFLGAAGFVGADNLQVGGVAVGAPPPPPAAGGTAGLASAGQAATSAGNRSADNEEEERRKRRQRRELLLDFLGFGERR